jgi:hypothetical protein
MKSKTHKLTHLITQQLAEKEKKIADLEEQIKNHKPDGDEVVGEKVMFRSLLRTCESYMILIYLINTPRYGLHESGKELTLLTSQLVFCSIYTACCSVSDEADNLGPEVEARKGKRYPEA